MVAQGRLSWVLFFIRRQMVSGGGSQQDGLKMDAMIIMADKPIQTSSKSAPRHKRTVWLHVFKNGSVCATEESYYVPTGRIACIKVELDFAEGDGL
jgi:hypothetical protein